MRCCNYLKCICLYLTRLTQCRPLKFLSAKLYSLDLLHPTTSTHDNYHKAKKKISNSSNLTNIPEIFHPAILVHFDNCHADLRGGCYRLHEGSKSSNICQSYRVLSTLQLSHSVKVIEQAQEAKLV